MITDKYDYRQVYDFMDFMITDKYKTHILKNKYNR